MIDYRSNENMKFLLIIFAALTGVAMGFLPGFNGFPDLNEDDLGTTLPPTLENGILDDYNFGDGNDPNAIDYRCHAMGGVCTTRLPGEPTCCPNGWTKDKTCTGDKWCCRRPAECERNNGGRCINTDSQYCPGTIVPFHANYSCPGGTHSNDLRCCRKDSECEKMPNGYCAAPEDGCKVTDTEVEGLDAGYCGDDATYKCCIRQPVGPCTNPPKGKFCSYMSDPWLTHSAEADNTLVSMCENGNFTTDTSVCTKDSSCLRKAIPSYLECVAADCIGAEVMYFSTIPDDLGFSIGTSNPQCKGRVVGIKIEMAPITTCDLESVKQICFVQFHGTGYDFNIPEGSNIWYIFCVFP